MSFPDMRRDGIASDGNDSNEADDGSRTGSRAAAGSASRRST
jgi:hypothetical protein